MRSSCLVFRNTRTMNLTSIEKADLKLDKKDRKGAKSLAKKDAKKLIDRFKEVLGDRVEDVRASERLVDSAATLVTGSTGMDAQTERMMRMMDENFESGKKVLEINTAHPLIRNLASLGDAEMVERSVLQLYDGAHLLEGTLENPADFVKRMTAFMEASTGASTQTGEDE